MVSDQALASCVESLLQQGGPAALTSVNGVVRQLEAKLGMDLSHKAAFIHDQIDILLGPRFPLLPPASAAGTHHFSHIPTAASQFTHLARHQHDHPPCFTAQMSQAAAAAASTAAHQQHINRHEYLPPPVMTPAPTPLVTLAPVPSPSPSPKGRIGPNFSVRGMRSLLKDDDPLNLAVGFGTTPSRSSFVVKEEHLEWPVRLRAFLLTSLPAAAKRRGGPGGLSKVCGVSPELQTIVGEPTMARTEIVKQLWAYIRKNNLQDPSNKRKIICNEELRLVFETDSTDMFKMNKLLSKHIVSLEPTSSDSKRLKKCDKEVGVPPETQTCQYPVVISDALAEFFGMGEREILQSVALRRVWDYIKAKHLEDPINNMILCDTKLQKLFGCESLFASGVSEMLAQHLFKQS